MLATKAELAPWSGRSSARAWTHGSGGADLTSPDSFPALGEPRSSQGGRTLGKAASAWTVRSRYDPTPEKQRKRDVPGGSQDRQPRKREIGASTTAYDELIAQYQQHQQKQSQQLDSKAEGAAPTGLQLVRQLSDSCRRAIESAEADRAAADAQHSADTEELDRVREDAVDELVSWGCAPMRSLFVLSFPFLLSRCVIWLVVSNETLYWLR